MADDGEDMKRHAWIDWMVVGLVALLGAQAPVCAWACSHVESTDRLAAHAPAPTRQDASQMPCHAGGERQRSDVPRQHEGCGCGLSKNLVASKAGASLPAPAAFDAVVPATHVAVHRVAYRDEAGLAHYDLRLPPTDLLIRKSTLNL